MNHDGMIPRIAAALGVRHDAAVTARLVDRLTHGLTAARARWANAPEPGDLLADYIGARLARQADLVAAVEALRVEDLFLAWWASTGDSAGIAAFEIEFADDVALLLARFRKLSPDDLRQRLRVKLFVGVGSTAPSIHAYTGSGSLQGWLRVTAARVFVDAARRDLRVRYDADLDDLAVLGLVAPGGSPRDRHAAAELTAAVKRAFSGAVAGLAPRERTFLRHASVDGLTLDQIAATYQVHRATVARVLKSARERLLAETRAAVAEELGLDPAQLMSAMSMLDSKLDLSLSRVLRHREDG